MKLKDIDRLYFMMKRNQDATNYTKVSFSIKPKELTSLILKNLVSIKQPIELKYSKDSLLINFREGIQYWIYGSKVDTLMNEVSKWFKKEQDEAIKIYAGHQVKFGFRDANCLISNTDSLNYFYINKPIFFDVNNSFLINDVDVFF